MKQENVEAFWQGGLESWPLSCGAGQGFEGREASSRLWQGDAGVGTPGQPQVGTQGGP